MTISVLRSSVCIDHVPLPRFVPSLSFQSDGTSVIVTVTGPPFVARGLASAKLMALPATPAGPAFTVTAIVCGAELPTSPPAPSNVVLLAVTVNEKFSALVPSCSVSVLPTSAPVSVKLDPLNMVLSFESVMVAPGSSPVIVTVSVSSESTGVTLIVGRTTVLPSFTVTFVPPIDNVGGSGPSPEPSVTSVPVPLS